MFLDITGPNWYNYFKKIARLTRCSQSDISDKIHQITRSDNINVRVNARNKPSILAAVSDVDAVSVVGGVAVGGAFVMGGGGAAGGTEREGGRPCPYVTLIWNFWLALAHCHPSSSPEKK